MPTRKTSTISTRLLRTKPYQSSGVILRDADLEGFNESTIKKVRKVLKEIKKRQQRKPAKRPRLAPIEENNDDNEPTRLLEEFQKAEDFELCIVRHRPDNYVYDGKKKVDEFTRRASDLWLFKDRLSPRETTRFTHGFWEDEEENIFNAPTSPKRSMYSTRIKASGVMSNIAFDEVNTGVEGSSGTSFKSARDIAQTARKTLTFNNKILSFGSSLDSLASQSTNAIKNSADQASTQENGAMSSNSVFEEEFNEDQRENLISEPSSSESVKSKRSIKDSHNSTGNKSSRISPDNLQTGIESSIRNKSDENHTTRKTVTFHNKTLPVQPSTSQESSTAQSVYHSTRRSERLATIRSETAPTLNNAAILTTLDRSTEIEPSELNTGVENVSVASIINDYPTTRKTVTFHDKHLEPSTSQDLSLVQSLFDEESSTKLDSVHTEDEQESHFLEPTSSEQIESKQSSKNTHLSSRRPPTATFNERHTEIKDSSTAISFRTACDKTQTISAFNDNILSHEQISSSFAPTSRNEAESSAKHATSGLGTKTNLFSNFLDDEQTPADPATLHDSSTGESLNLDDSSLYSSDQTGYVTELENTLCGDYEPLEQLFRICKQSTHVPFESLLDPDSKPKKLGEGSYGEVFLAQIDGVDVALKIVPFTLDDEVREINGDFMKTASAIMPEAIISNQLSRLSTNPCNTTHGFVRVVKMCIVKGNYPQPLLEAWDAYKKKGKDAINDSPLEYSSEDQLYIAIALANAGKDLEKFKVNKENESLSILLQIITSLQIAEKVLEFEHRDLHVGNVLINRVDPNEVIEYCVDGQPKKLHSNGVVATIIDFTNSRINKDGLTIFLDLATDAELFEGPADEYQFEIYRKMRTTNENNWHLFTPKSNCLWVHYLSTKLLLVKGMRLKRRKELQEVFDMVLGCDNLDQFMELETVVGLFAPYQA